MKPATTLVLHVNAMNPSSILLDIDIDITLALSIINYM